MIVRNARDLNPEAIVIVRTRFVRETDNLIRLGATTVIPEQFETAIEAATAALSAAGIDEGAIRETITELRSNQYASMRQIESLAFAALDQGRFAEPAEAAVFSIHLGPESPLVGRPLADLDLRNRFGLSLLQIQRGSEAIVNPAGTTELAIDDTLMLFGPRRNRHALMRDRATQRQTP